MMKAAPTDFRRNGNSFKIQKSNQFKDAPKKDVNVCSTKVSSEMNPNTSRNYSSQHNRRYQSN